MIRFISSIRTYIKFLNSQNELNLFQVKPPFLFCSSYLVLKDGIIAVLNSNNTSHINGHYRRNIIKIDQKGNTIWRIKEGINSKNEQQYFNMVVLNDDFTIEVSLNNGIKYYLHSQTGDIQKSQFKNSEIDLLDNGCVFKHINLAKNQIRFINKDNQIIIFDSKELGFESISSVLNYNEEILILCFDVNYEQNQNLHDLRRNVIAIDSMGNVVWRIHDMIDIWKKRLNNNENKLKNIEKIPMDNVFFNNSKDVVLGSTSGAEYLLNPENGEISYIKSSK